MQSVRPLPFSPAPPPSTGPTAINAANQAFGALIKSAIAQGNGQLIAQLTEMLLQKSSLSIGNPLSSPAGLPQHIQAYQRAAGTPIPSRPWPVGTGAQSPVQQTPASASVDKLTVPLEQNLFSAGKDRQFFDDMIHKAAKRHGLPVHLVRAVVTAESDYNPRCVSKAGAMGLMQLMPETAQDLGVKDPFDPEQNINGGARYLAMMLERFNGNLKQALAAYNFGPSNVEAKCAWPSETRNYVAKVTRLSGLYANGFKARA